MTLVVLSTFVAVLMLACEGADRIDRRLQRRRDKATVRRRLRRMAIEQRIDEPMGRAR